MPPQEEFDEPSTNTQEEPTSLDDELDVGSMLEDIEIGSGCVADMQKTANPTPSQKELQIQDILDSPMLNKAKELFDVKKITVRPKT